MSNLSVFYKDGLPSNEYKVKTLCYLTRTNPKGETEYLLGMHYKQKKWNGSGGKVGDNPKFKDETVEQGLERECLEELGVIIKNPVKRGVILFVFYDEQGEQNNVLCHLFFASEYEGEITGSKEFINPTWFTLEDMPWDEMWPNDRIWLEEVLKRDQFLEAEFIFDPEKGLIADNIKMEWTENERLQNI